MCYGNMKITCVRQSASLTNALWRIRQGSVHRYPLLRKFLSLQLSKYDYLKQTNIFSLRRKIEQNLEEASRWGCGRYMTPVLASDRSEWRARTRPIPGFQWGKASRWEEGGVHFFIKFKIGKLISHLKIIGWHYEIIITSHPQFGFQMRNFFEVD